MKGKISNNTVIILGIFALKAVSSAVINSVQFHLCICIFLSVCCLCKKIRSFQ